MYLSIKSIGALINDFCLDIILTLGSCMELTKFNITTIQLEFNVLASNHQQKF